MSRLFITGGTGFFGKSMLDYRLRHADWEWARSEWVVLSRDPAKFIAAHPRLANQSGVSFVSGDVRDFELPPGKFDAIIHAATSAVTDLDDDEMTSVIIDGTRRVMEFARCAGCDTLLYVSSGAVYGPMTSPASEDDECRPATAYGRGKFEAERILSASGLDVKVARCFAFTGPYLNRRIHYAIGNFIQNCLDGAPIIIKGDGTPQRSYLYADDLVEWLFAILQRGVRNRPYNVGSRRALSIAELANAVRLALGAASGISVALPPSSNPPQVYVPDTSRANTELSLSEKFTLEDAIALSAKSPVYP